MNLLFDVSTSLQLFVSGIMCLFLNKALIRKKNALTFMNSRCNIEYYVQCYVISRVLFKRIRELMRLM